MTRVVVESSDLPLSQKDRIEFTWEDREYLLVKDYLYRLCSHNEEARSFILGDFVVGDGSLYLYAKHGSRMYNFDEAIAEDLKLPVSILPIITPHLSKFCKTKEIESATYCKIEESQVRSYLKELLLSISTSPTFQSSNFLECLKGDYEVYANAKRIIMHSPEKEMHYYAIVFLASQLHPDDEAFLMNSFEIAFAQPVMFTSAPQPESKAKRLPVSSTPPTNGKQLKITGFKLANGTQ